MDKKITFRFYCFRSGIYLSKSVALIQMKAAEKRQLGPGNQRADIGLENRKKKRQLLMMSIAYYSILSAFI